MDLEVEFLVEDNDDEKTINFIKSYLPQELKERFTDDEFCYFIDVIAEYYAISGCLEAEPDSDGYVNIDQEAVVSYVVKEAKQDDMGDFKREEILWVVKGEMEYGNSLCD